MTSTSHRHAATPLLRQLVSLGLVAIIGVGWAGGYTLNRLAVDAGVPLLSVAFWQCLGPTVLLAPVLLVRRASVPITPSFVRYYAIMGLFAVVLAYVAIIYAAPHVPVGVLSLEVTLEPAFTYAFALLLAMERFHRLRFLGFVTGMAGLMVIVVPEAGLPSREMVPWVLLGLAAPISWAVFNVWLARTRPPKSDTVSLAFGMFAASSVLLIVPLAVTGEWWWFSGRFDQADWAMLAAIVYNPIIWILAIECIRLYGPVFYSTWGYVGTPAGLGFGMVAFGESHSGWIYGALVLLLVGLFLVNRTSSEARVV